MGLVVPDGVLNNQGEQSNCPSVRRFLARSGRIEAIISLPDHAFRRSGAQNKTSILFFRKFSRQEAGSFDRALALSRQEVPDVSEAIARAIERANLTYDVFLAEANNVGYTPSGTPSDRNDLYRAATTGGLDENQDSAILGEWRRFRASSGAYQGRALPDCLAISFSELWRAHDSHRLDPKYHIFKRQATQHMPAGWIRARLGDVMEPRDQIADVEDRPDEPYRVMTLGQSGEIRPREAGKGRNPPDWTGAYLANSPSTWYLAEQGDVVYSSIDLWKGCISVVPPTFAGALVSKEFPIYRVVDGRILPEFLQVLLRSRYYQRAFRAITTGHSNRRRTQSLDFEALEIAFPPDVEEQRRLVRATLNAREAQKEATEQVHRAMLVLSDIVDGRGDEELPDVEVESDASDDE